MAPKAGSASRAGEGSKLIDRCNGQSGRLFQIKIGLFPWPGKMGTAIGFAIVTVELITIIANFANLDDTVATSRFGR